MTITTYNSFSALNLEYFEFSPISEGFSPKKESLCLDNGLKFNLFPLLSATRDFSFNKKTGMFLTTFHEASSIYDAPTSPINQDFTEINSPLVYSNGSIISPSAQNLIITSKTVASLTDVLNFKKVDDYLWIKNSDSFYLTFNPLNNTLLFKTKISPDSVLQKFEYILKEQSLVLFPYGYNKDRIVITSPTLSVSSYNLNTFYSNISSYCLGLYSFTAPTQIDYSFGDFVARYDNNPIENTESLKMASGINDQIYKQNYLAIFPYEYRKDGNYPLYIHGLKNYQTPEYDYSNGANNYQDLPWVRREYDQIFTGTNQYGGLGNVFLGYRGKTKKTVFYKDKENTFFYPIISPRVSVHSSGLIEDGAKPGDIPFESDRIFINNIDYSEFLPEQELPETITKFDGTWACSWLSGNSLGDSMWMDRYYNSAYYTLDQALSAGTRLYNDKIVDIIENTWDEVSKLYLEPGVRYSYYRIGDTSLSEYVSGFGFEYGNDTGKMLLNVKNWNSSPLKDESPYKHNGVLFYNKPINLKTTHWVLDGSNHAIFSTDDTLLNTDKFTTSLWVNVDDWSNIQGEQIFGNYYNSGYGLINSSTITAPLFTVSENVGGEFSTFNYRLLRTNTVDITPAGDYSIQMISNQENKIIQKLPNFDYWVFDCYNLIGRKFDVEGKVLIVVLGDILSPHLTKISQVESDSEQNLYLMDYTTKKLVKLDPLGDYISTSTLTGQSFQIDLNNQVVDCYGKCSNIDSSNNLWEIVGGNLYSNQQIYANIGQVQQISFDSSDSLWILHGQDTISKLNTLTGKFDFVLRIGFRSSLPEDPCILASLPENHRTIDFLKLPAGSSTSGDVAVIVDVFDNEVYLVSQAGQLLSKFSLQAITTGTNFHFYAEGDFSGYQYIRKYGSLVKSLAWKFKISKPDGSSPAYHSLSYSTEKLYKGWHHFSLVFDSYKGSAEYYIDSILVDSVAFEKYLYNIRFDYKASLLLGATSIKNKVLNDVIGISNGYKFIGSISDLRIYATSLTQSQIRDIYYISPFSFKLKDLEWNMPIGERNFIESIDKWYKMQITGSKSKLFNLKLHNLYIDDTLKPIIETSLRNVIKKIIPSYSTLDSILWE